MTLPSHWRGWLIAVVLAYIALFTFTRTDNYTDSFNYAKHVVDQENHAAPEGITNPFYNFGHPLWRPLGLLVWSPLRQPLHDRFGGDDILAAGAVLIAINLSAGLLGAIAMFLWIARVTSNARIAALTTCAYVVTNALLHYTTSGMAYTTGISLQIVALCLLQYALCRDRFSWLAGSLAGLFLGLSVGVWFPNILGTPGVFVYALWAGQAVPVRRRIPGLAGLVLVATLVCAVTYAAMIALAKLHSLADISAWIAQSRYGLVPDRGFLRMMGGIPRGFFWLGDTNLALKRLLFAHQSLSLLKLIQTGFGKIVLVYAVLAGTVLSLWRSETGRRLLITLLAYALPLFYFAAFLFDPSPPERYLAAFPVLFLAFGFLLSSNSGMWLRSLLAVLFASMLIANVSAYSRFKSDREFDGARANLRILNQSLRPGDSVYLLSDLDQTMLLLRGNPFSPDTRNRYCFATAIPWHTFQEERWRAVFAKAVLDTWARGGRVWLSKVVLAPSPKPSWGWVEGDMPSIHWKDLPEFFSQLDFTASFGDAEGFSEVPPTEKNKVFLSAQASR